MINDTTPPKPQNTRTGSCSKPPVFSNSLDASDTLLRYAGDIASLLKGDDDARAHPV